MTKVKIKTQDESLLDGEVARVTIKKQIAPKAIPAHLAAILAMKPAQTVQVESEAISDPRDFYKSNERLEPDPDRSLVHVTWDKKDRLVLEFDDGEKLISPPVPINAVSGGSVIIAGDGSGGSATGIAESFETVSKNLDATDAIYAYNVSGDLQTITYASGVVKTLNYTTGSLTSVVLSGATPGGIELTKSFTYTSGNLTQVNYS